MNLPVESASTKAQRGTGCIGMRSMPLTFSTTVHGVAGTGCVMPFMDVDAAGGALNVKRPLATVAVALPVVS